MHIGKRHWTQLLTLAKLPLRLVKDQLNLQSERNYNIFTFCNSVQTANEATVTVTVEGNNFKTCQTAPGLLLQCLLGTVYKVCFVDLLSSVQIAWTLIFFLNLFVNKVGSM